MTCEDFPCCGHELGCCPDFDESGRQLNMKCGCGAVLPVNNRSSCCDSCLNNDREYDDYGFPNPHAIQDTYDEYGFRGPVDFEDHGYDLHTDYGDTD